MGLAAGARLACPGPVIGGIMLISHEGFSPQVHPTAFIAPSATICGDVKIGPDCRIMHGASIVAEGGGISIGKCCIVFENAVIRSNPAHSVNIAGHCLIGPHAHLAGCTIEEQVFIATGVSVFHGAQVGQGSEIRVNAVVHLKSFLAPGTMVPIGWVAVGNPAQLFPPEQHDNIWDIQKPLNFPLTVYGFERSEASMKK
jgi:carbonic anhydrase/acetyltransferase-like protein (isoleucine patch superfamily)